MTQPRVYGFLFTALLPHLPGCSTDTWEDGAWPQAVSKTSAPPLDRGDGERPARARTPDPLPCPAPRRGGSGHHCSVFRQTEGLWLNFFLLPQFLPSLGKCRKKVATFASDRERGERGGLRLYLI